MVIPTITYTHLDLRLRLNALSFPHYFICGVYAARAGKPMMRANRCQPSSMVENAFLCNCRDFRM